jgi:hypothetical protein
MEIINKIYYKFNLLFIYEEEEDVQNTSGDTLFGDGFCFWIGT